MASLSVLLGQGAAALGVASALLEAEGGGGVFLFLRPHRAALAAASSAMAVGAFFGASRMGLWQTAPMLPAAAAALAHAAGCQPLLSAAQQAALLGAGAGLSALLLLAFPVPRLPPTTGPFAHLGVKTVVHAPRGRSGPAALLRVFYPARVDGAGTAHASEASRYDASGRLGRAIAAYGLSGFLKCASFFMLDYLRLVPLRAAEGAPLTRGPAHGLPVVVFSHGMGTNINMYSAYLCELASHGFVVVGIEHLDGSNIMAEFPDGSFKDYDAASVKAARESTDDKEIWLRRRQLETRVREVHDAVDFVKSINQVPRLELPGFVGSLNLDKMYMTGHSFGGATALTYVHRQPGVFQRACLLDPAVDWAAHDLHRDVLPSDLLEKFTPPAPPHRRAALEVAARDSAPVSTLTPLLFVYSEAWVESGYALTHELAELVQRGTLADGSRLCGVRGATHVAFSDAVLLMPARIATALRLAQAGVPPERTPRLAAHLTLCFIDALAGGSAPQSNAAVASAMDFAAAEHAPHIIFPVPASSA